MKDIYKNPIFYYVLVPIVVALWPLLIRAVYLPKAQHNWKTEKSQYNKAQKTILTILAIDPDRLEFADSQEAASEFDYAVSVERIASLCGITSTNYNISSKPIRTTGGQKTEDALVVLKEVDMAQFANFLSIIQLRWANLKCERLTITRREGLPDAWKVDLNFKYYH